jgi:hypothetical protein
MIINVYIVISNFAFITEKLEIIQLAMHSSIARTIVVNFCKLN